MYSQSILFVMKKENLGGFDFRPHFLPDGVEWRGFGNNGLAIISFVPEKHKPLVTTAATFFAFVPDDREIAAENSRLLAIFLELLSPDVPSDKNKWLADNLPKLKQIDSKGRPVPVKDKFGPLFISMNWLQELGMVKVTISEKDGPEVDVSEVLERLEKAMKA